MYTVQLLAARNFVVCLTKLLIIKLVWEIKTDGFLPPQNKWQFVRLLTDINLSEWRILRRWKYDR